MKTKPGALPGSTALAQARANGTFTSAHDAFWAAARKTDGDADGTRELINVLLLHRSMHALDVIAGINAALTVGAVSADVVAVEARRAAAEREARGWAPDSRPPRARNEHPDSSTGCQSHPTPPGRPRSRDLRTTTGHSPAAIGGRLRPAAHTPHPRTSRQFKVLTRRKRLMTPNPPVPVSQSRRS